MVTFLVFVKFHFTSSFRGTKQAGTSVLWIGGRDVRVPVLSVKNFGQISYFMTL